MSTYSTTLDASPGLHRFSQYSVSGHAINMLVGWDVLVNDHLILRFSLPGQKIERSGAGHGSSSARLRWAGRRDSVAVNVDAEVLAGEHDRPVVGKSHIEALRMFHAAFQRRHEPPIGREERRVEVVVVVGNQDAAHRVNADANRIVCDTLAADLAQKCAIVAKHLFKTTSAHTGNSNLPSQIQKYIVSYLLVCEFHSMQLHLSLANGRITYLTKL